MKRTTSLASVLFLSLLTTPALAQPKVERNVIYGMYSGLALLMDVYRPESPNGYGVIFISGSGWRAPLELNAKPLKQSGQEKVYAVPLAEAGYTVFSINHRATPRFQYPAHVEDVQRAVRFVRHNAKQFRIDAGRIGAVGGSSGGHLVSMLGALDGAGLADDDDPVNRESAKVQCVVARAAPVDLGLMRIEPVEMFVGDEKNYKEASPINYVSSDDPPFLLLHGDADETVPFAQSEKMKAALDAVGVEARLVNIPGGGHGATFGNVKTDVDYVGETIRWMDAHLKTKGTR